MVCSIIDLVKRLSVLENLILNEGKQVGKLYHVCTLDDLAKYIVPTDTLSSSGNYKNYLKNGRADIISFTRDKGFIVYTDKIADSPILVQFEIDGDLLSRNKKVFPYNDLAFDEDGNPIDEDQDDISYREKEECVIGSIRNISRYITNTKLYVSLQLFKDEVNIRYTLNLINKCYSYLSKINTSIFRPKENRLFEKSALRVKGEEGSMLVYDSVDALRTSLIILNNIIIGKDVSKDQIGSVFSHIKDPSLLYNYIYYWFNRLGDGNLLNALCKYRPELATI